MRDIVQSFARWPFWSVMAWQDIKQRYRGSTLGPFWSTANLLVVVLGIGILFSAIFDQPLETFIPYITAGMFVWTFISTTITESVNAYVVAGPLIRQTQTPMLLFVLRVVYRNAIVMAHNVLVVAVVFAYFQVLPDFLYLLFGLVLIIANVIWISTLVALFATRYRDANQAITHLLSLALFLSPIFWPVSAASERAAFILYNPFAHLLEVVRSPLLGDPPAMLSVIICAVMALIGFAFAALIHGGVRRRIVFWL